MSDASAADTPLPEKPEKAEKPEKEETALEEAARQQFGLREWDLSLIHI